MGDSKTSGPGSTAPSKTQISVLTNFNAKVTRLESTNFYKRYRHDAPNIIMKFDRLDSVEFVETVNRSEDEPVGQINLSGYVRARVEDFDQDAIEAFILTYRLITQDNDRLSIRNLAKLYSASWVPDEGREHLSKLRLAIQGILSSSISTDFGDGPVTCGELVDVVVYGELAHSSETKAKQFASWTSNPTMAAAVWIEFMGYLRQVMPYLIQIKYANIVLLHNYCGVEYEGPRLQNEDGTFAIDVESLDLPTSLGRASVHFHQLKST